MEIMEAIKGFVIDQALVLIPALYVVGAILKHIAVIPDKWIPLILLPIGIGLCLWIMGPSASAVIQGILVTGAAVYGNQVWKQMKKSE